MQQSVGYVILTLEFRKDGRRWLGRCRELTTSTFAATLDAARQELQELVLLHLNELEVVEERPRFFKEHGIALYAIEPTEVERTLSVSSSNDWLILAQALPVEIFP